MYALSANWSATANELASHAFFFAASFTYTAVRYCPKTSVHTPVLIKKQNRDGMSVRQYYCSCACV
jgi:hypothetical protein